MQASTADTQTTAPDTQDNTSQVQPEVKKEVPPPVSHDDDTSAMAEFRTKVLNKPARISLADERKVFGKIVCMDQLKNIVVVDAIEEIPQQYIAKLNEKVPIISKSIMKIKNFVKLAPEVEADEEQVKKLEEEFFKNKFYLGQAIIPGHCIAKIEVMQAS